MVKRWTYLSVNTKDAPDSAVDSTETGAIVTRFAYTQSGMTDSIIAPNGHRTKIEYRTGPTDPLRGLVQAMIERSVPTWDTISKTEPASNLRTAFGFNALGNVVSDTSPMGRVRTFTRDATQRVTDGYDPEGHRVELIYNPLNRVIRALQHVENLDSGFTAPLETQWHFAIDVIDSVMDTRKVLRRFAYDAAGRPIREYDDFGHAEERYLNRAGLIDSVRSRFDSGASTPPVVFAYDEAGRRTKISWPLRAYIAADSVQFTYDLVGRQLTANTALRQVTNTYFATGALKTQVQSAGGVSVRYFYDRLGRRRAYIVGTVGDLNHSDSVWYAYHLTSGDLRAIGVRWRDVTHSKDSVLFYWDSLGRRDSVRYTNGTILKFAYDGEGIRRLFCGTHPGNPSPSPDVFDFTVYNSSANRDGLPLRTDYRNTGIGGCGQSDLSSNEQLNTFDSRHQLKSQVIAFGSATFLVYDGSGNIVRYRGLGPSGFDDIHTTDSTHNLLVRSRSVAKPDSGMNFLYNVNGSRREEIPVRGDTLQWFSDGHRQYFFDGLERLSGTATYIGGQLYGGPNDCRYDPLGRLYDPCENAAPNVGFDGQNVIRTGPDGGTGWTFVHGPGLDDPIMGYFESVAHGSDRHAYWITDGQGRQVGVGDSTGRDFSGENQYALAQNGGKFAGGVRNATTFDADRFTNPEQPKLSFFRNRFYDQATGRWTQEDPVGLAGGMNLYGFVGNNPAIYTDPFGLDLCSDLRDEIKANAAEAMGYIRRYLAAYAKGDADTGHRQRIKQFQNTHERLKRRYEQAKCRKPNDHDDGTGGGEANAVFAIPLPDAQVQRSHGWRPRGENMATCGGSVIRAAAFVAAVILWLDDITGIGAADDPAAVAASAIAICPQ